MNYHVIPFRPDEAKIIYEMCPDKCKDAPPLAVTYRFKRLSMVFSQLSIVFHTVLEQSCSNFMYTNML